VNNPNFFISLLGSLITAICIILRGILTYPIQLLKDLAEKKDDGCKIRCSLCNQDIANKPNIVKIEVHHGDVFYFCSESHSYLHFFMSGWSY